MCYLTWNITLNRNLDEFEFRHNVQLTDYYTHILAAGPARVRWALNTFRLDFRLD